MRTALLTLLGSAIYATARYNIFKGVPWSDWPTYVMNKAFALSALLLLAITVIRQRLTRGYSAAQTMYMAGVFAALHVVLSLTVLTPAYYEKFFWQGKLTAAAGWSMAFGAIAAVLMAFNTRAYGDQRPNGKAKKVAILAVLIGLHAMLQGFAGWLAPAQWPGMMPPITLISFLLALATAAIAFGPKRTE